MSEVCIPVWGLLITGGILGLIGIFIAGALVPGKTES